jgi:hypothetical protein
MAQNFNTLRNTLNDSYDLIRPVVSQALNQLITSAESNEEQHVIQDINNLIIDLCNIRMNQNDSIQIYLDSNNTQYSSTRQFLEQFQAPRINVNLNEL